MELQKVTLSELKLDPNNARKHSKKNLTAIKGSLEKFGQQKPIVVDGNNIVIAGNGTVAAATELGWKTIQAVKTQLTGAKAKAFALADNRSAELAEWDMEVLGEQLQGLFEEGFDIEGIGFDLGEFNLDKQESEGLTDPDKVPEDVETRCKSGELWQLGKHRVMCGDSTNLQHVELLMNNKLADMVFTDPPYGIAYKGGSKKRDEIQNDAIDILPFYRDFLSIAKAFSKKGASIYIWHAQSETHNCINAAIEAGWLYKQCIVWIKNNSTFGRADYHWQHEAAFYGWGADGAHEWYGDRKQTTTWHIDRPLKSEEHPTMKPVELCERGILNSSAQEHIIYEPFCGSGPTLMACERTKRICYGMEIDPHYCDVIIKRWEDFTGKKAEKIDG